MIEAAIVTYLLADAQIAALAGERVDHDATPQGEADPRITVMRVDTQRSDVLEGPTGLAHARVQIDCWAGTKVAAKQLADRVRIRLNGFAGNMAGVTVRGCTLENERDSYEKPATAREMPEFGIAMDFMVSHLEAIA